MSMFETSKCPTCRSSYSYFPRVCEGLHEYISESFPEEAAARARMAAEEEESRYANSPDPKTGAVGSSAAASKPKQRKQYLMEHFICAHPGCRMLLCRPTVLTCGHMICLDSCAHDDSCKPIANCPACGERASETPKTCHLVHELLQQELPEEQVERSAAIHQITENRKSAVKQQTPSSSLNALDRNSILESLRNSEGVTAGGLRLIDAMSTHFVHHGVGCDQCGQFPIVGDRFRCIDCCEVEHMGFDLCGHCMADVDPESVHGRFNQSHTPNHRMEKVDKQPSIIHMFQALNPDIPMPELMRMVSMQFQSESDTAAESEASGATSEPSSPSLEDDTSSEPLGSLPLTRRRPSIRRVDQQMVQIRIMDMLLQSVEYVSDEEEEAILDRLFPQEERGEQQQLGPTSPSATLGSPILAPPQHAAGTSRPQPSAATHSSQHSTPSSLGILPMFRRQQLYRRTLLQRDSSASDEQLETQGDV
eukprot:CAMPEP_0117688338 /NCGR_PEP_ID=MMETSP0804-20121206/23760_1 /TAXON_ID=1074897 /ORGANISM="Tetraselmis astigmatica, Strain CCMP880" /LENGTH=477 /DNA_ID=CAMNT_0005500751 /DNA_START=86 /DNA_END=1519 /DNA_ORIENTATION=+